MLHKNEAAATQKKNLHTHTHTLDLPHELKSQNILKFHKLHKRNNKICSGGHAE